MPAASRCRSLSLWAISLVILCSLYYSLIPSNTMESLDFSFKIEVDGKAIAQADEGVQSPTQAVLGTKNAAIFTLQKNKLMSGDWILARNKTEDRSLLPKKILWFKMGTENEERAQPVSAEKEGSDYQIKFSGMCAGCISQARCILGRLTVSCRCKSIG